MSIRGTIFPCENAQTYEEAIGHVSSLLYPDIHEEMALALLKKIDLFKEYFFMFGAFTHASTRTMITLKKQEKESWKDLTFRVFSANQMKEMAKDFYASSRSKEGWLVSEWQVDTQSVRAHHQCLFVEKRDGAIKLLTIDRRPNLEGIRNYILASFLPFEIPLHMYISTQKRQHDWSQCPILTLDDLRQLYTMSDTNELYSFIEQTYTSIETDRNQKWKLYASPYVLPQFMRLVQSMNDFIIYEKAVAENGFVDKVSFEKVKEKICRKNPGWDSEKLTATLLSKRITNRYIKYGKILVNRILNDTPPVREIVL